MNAAGTMRKGGGKWQKGKGKGRDWGAEVEDTQGMHEMLHAQ